MMAGKKRKAPKTKQKKRAKKRKVRSMDRKY